MSSFQLDQATGDLQLTNNALTLTQGAEAKRQHLQSSLRLFLGEWFLDTSKGVPWYSDILVKQQTFSVVREILKKKILETPGIISITKFKFDFDSNSRTASLEFSCLSTDGPIDFTGLDAITVIVGED